MKAHGTPTNKYGGGRRLADLLYPCSKSTASSQPRMRRLVSTLEARRHSIRKSGAGSQLSQEGVDRARSLGESVGPFSRVVTTVVPRTRETALAMGFAVDYELVVLSGGNAARREHEASRWWEADRPFVSLASMLAAHGPAYQTAHTLVSLWRDVLLELPADASVLFIGHSGDLEAALVAAFPTADHGAWGRAFGALEGARITFTGDPPSFANVEILRLDSHLDATR